jgi:hypothetical protein
LTLSQLAIVRCNGQYLPDILTSVTIVILRYDGLFLTDRYIFGIENRQPVLLKKYCTDGFWSLPTDILISITTVILRYDGLFLPDRYIFGIENRQPVLPKKYRTDRIWSLPTDILISITTVILSYF